MNDDFLERFRKEPRPKFASALYQRISTPVQIQSRFPLRLITVTISLVAIPAAAMLLSPSAFAFAEGLIRQIGGYVFVQGGQSISLRGSSGPIRVVKTLGSVSIETIGKVPRPPTRLRPASWSASPCWPPPTCRTVSRP